MESIVAASAGGRGRRLLLVAVLLALIPVAALASRWLPRPPDPGQAARPNPVPVDELVTSIPLDGLRRPAAALVLPASRDVRLLRGAVAARSDLRALVALQIRCSPDGSPAHLQTSRFTTANARGEGAPVIQSVQFALPPSDSPLRCQLAVYSQTAVQGLTPSHRVALSDASLSVVDTGFEISDLPVQETTVWRDAPVPLVDTLVAVPQGATRATIVSELEVSTFGDNDPLTPPDGRGTVALSAEPGEGTCASSTSSRDHTVDPVEHHTKWHDSLRLADVRGCRTLRIVVTVLPGHRGPYLLEGPVYSSVTILWSR